ncbi:MAG: hypothetical protein LBV43_10080 [Prevotella sp.]|jgi:hypothetical protein|nr:hypothetical protein [Prevotella sp.]
METNYTENLDFTKLDHLHSSNTYVKKMKDLILEDETINEPVKRDVLILYTHYHLHYRQFITGQGKKDNVFKRIVTKLFK